MSTSQNTHIPTQGVLFSAHSPYIDVSNVAVSNFSICEIKYKQCLDFCAVWHYSKGCPAGKAYFGLFYNSDIIGIICYGEPAMRNQKRCYGADIELRRLCCIDLTPKNTESYFIGRTLKIIKKMGFRRCLSLADPNHGHIGTIYRASNFTYMGRELGGGSRDVIVDGVKMHSRSAFAKFGTSGYKGLVSIMPNASIQVVEKERKHIYIYDLYDRKFTANIAIKPTQK